MLFWESGIEVDAQSRWAGGVWSQEVGSSFTHDGGGLDVSDKASAGFTVGKGHGWNSSGGHQLLEVTARQSEEDGLLSGRSGGPVEGAVSASTEGAGGGHDGTDDSEEFEHFLLN